MTKRAITKSKRKASAAPKGSGALTMELSLARRMPAEWERHKATWIAWPHHEPDWPGKLACVAGVALGTLISQAFIHWALNDGSQ